MARVEQAISEWIASVLANLTLWGPHQAATTNDAIPPSWRLGGVSLSTILAPPTAGNLPAWQFEHAMAHRELFGAMAIAPPEPVQGEFFVGAAGLNRFTVLPYFIDPQRNIPPWHFDHGQAHQDYQNALPIAFGIESLGALDPTIDYIDTNLAGEGQLIWWTFANHQAHLVAQTVLPIERTLPFW